MKAALLSFIALIAFAGNSVLCRLALADGSIDPTGFTLIRLSSGVAVLWILLLLTQKTTLQTEQRQATGSSLSAIMLFVYALLFSYAYVSIDTATGALVLFGSVQLTLITVGIVKGNKLGLSECAGVLLAFSGFVYLVLPELQKPSLTSFIMMSVAGVAWAMYTVGGQGSLNALRDTTFNFTRTLPLLFALLIVGFNSVVLSPYGVTMAILSGAITSGLGYAVWYAALPNLTTIQAGVIQLFVPIIAAVGGVLFANEVISVRLSIAAMLVLGGITLVILAKRKAE